jgi:hypothetical protein
VLAVPVPFRVGNQDTWTQLAVGRYIMQEGIPHTDPFSYVIEGRPYSDHEWLASLLLYAVYSVGGVVGMVGLKLSLIGTAFLLSCLTARALGASYGSLALAFPLLAFVVFDRIVERPHLFSSLGLAAYSFLFFQVRQGSLRPCWLWLMLPMHLVWANLHGGHIQGIALMGVFGLGEGAAWVRSRYADSSVPAALPGCVVLHLSDSPLRSSLGFLTPQHIGGCIEETLMLLCGKGL